MKSDLPRILLVEDEPAQRDILSYNLRAEGYQVECAASGDEAIEFLMDDTPDLIVLDWMLPGVSGIEICRRVRVNPKTRDVPIVMLTARGDEQDRVRGLDTGADDFVVKPYSVKELVARIRRHLQKTRPGLTGQVLRFEGLELNAETHRVTLDGKELKLGPTEFRLLLTLMERPGRVWSRESLLDRVWGRDIYVESRTVDVHVGRLRKTLGSIEGREFIRTVRGAGYALG